MDVLVAQIGTMYMYAKRASIHQDLPTIISNIGNSSQIDDGSMVAGKGRW